MPIFGPKPGRPADAWPETRRPARVVTVEATVRLAPPPDEVFEWTLDGRNFQEIFPDPIRPLAGWTEYVVRPGGVYAFRQWAFHLVPLTWVVKIVDWDPPRRYADLAVRAPLRYFRHTHLCEGDGTGGTRYTDRVELRSAGPLWLDRHLLRRNVAWIFAHRQRRMAEILGTPAAAAAGEGVP